MSELMFSTRSLISGVFLESEQVDRVDEVLTDTVNRGGKIWIGGSSVRSLLGIRRLDMRQKCRELVINFSDGEWLNDYAMAIAQGMTGLGKDEDVDLFVDNVTLTELDDRLNKSGLKTRKAEATGDIEILCLDSPRGQITAVNKKDSWQFNNWPRIGLMAELRKDGLARCVYEGTDLYEHALEVEGLELLEQQRRFAVAARILLWATTIQGELPIPDYNEAQQEVFECAVMCHKVFTAFKLLEIGRISSYERDMAIWEQARVLWPRNMGSLNEPIARGISKQKIVLI